MADPYLLHYLAGPWAVYESTGQGGVLEERRRQQDQGKHVLAILHRLPPTGNLDRGRNSYAEVELVPRISCASTARNYATSASSRGVPLPIGYSIFGTPLKQ